MKHAGTLSLRSGTQESLFQELDALMMVGDKDKRDKATNLTNDITKALQRTREKQREVERMANCDDLERPQPLDKQNAPRLLAQLDTFVQGGEAAGLAPDSPAGDQMKSFEKEVQGLLKKVSSESEALATKFPIEKMETEREDERAPSSPVAKDAAASQASPKAEDKVMQDHSFFNELDSLIETDLQEVHRAKTSDLVSRISATLGASQQALKHTHLSVERLLLGQLEESHAVTEAERLVHDEEGENAHPLDQEHAAWRKNTLQVLKGKPAPAPKRSATNPRLRRATVSVPRGGHLLPPQTGGMTRQVSDGGGVGAGLAQTLPQKRSGSMVGESVRSPGNCRRSSAGAAFPAMTQSRSSISFARDA